MKPIKDWHRKETRKIGFDEKIIIWKEEAEKIVIDRMEAKEKKESAKSKQYVTIENYINKITDTEIHTNKYWYYFGYKSIYCCILNQDSRLIVNTYDKEDYLTNKKNREYCDMSESSEIFEGETEITMQFAIEYVIRKEAIHR